MIFQIRSLTSSGGTHFTKMRNLAAWNSNGMSDNKTKNSATKGSFWSRLTGKHKFITFSELGITTEYHCHILPGVDDGVKASEESINILHDMVKAGYRQVKLTPHMNPDIYLDNTEDYIRMRYELFVSSLPEDITSSLQISLGGEYMVTGDFHERNAGELFQFDEGKVLIEMSYMYPSRNLEGAIFNITFHGLTPVLAHPERYLYLADHLDRFERFHDMGCEFQLNLLSLEGVYGPGSVKIMDYLLKNGLYTYLGSDTHTLQHLHHIIGMNIPVKRAESIRAIIR